MPLSVAAACSSKLNERQNRLRSARPHARLMRAPNGVCRISCIPPASSKKRSATIVSIGRHDAENRLAGAHVRDGLFGARRRRAPQSLDQATRVPRIVALVDCGAHGRDFARELDRAAQAFAVPKRNRRRRAVRVFDAHDAGFDAADRPRVRAEQEDVAGHALDREIFVERADDVPVGLGDDVVVRGVGNRAAAT